MNYRKYCQDLLNYQFQNGDLEDLEEFLPMAA
jgi:hypothetical protein